MGLAVSRRHRACALSRILISRRSTTAPGHSEQPDPGSTPHPTNRPSVAGASGICWPHFALLRAEGKQPSS